MVKEIVAKQVVLESLRQDAMTPELMPNTTALARTARVYDQHFSTGNATRYGLFGLLYGLPGGYWDSMLSEQRGSQLFDVLQQQGYDLHLYGSAPLYSPEHFNFALLMQAVSIAVLSFLGFDAISTAAEEAKDPKRDLPRGLIGAALLQVMGAHTCFYKNDEIVA